MVRVYTFVFTTVGPDYERRFTFNGSKGQIEAVLQTGRPGGAASIRDALALAAVNHRT